MSQAEYTRQSNVDSLVCIQVAYVVALRNLEEIAAVPGVDVVFLGPSDLSQSLGFAGQHTVPQVVRAMEDAFNRLKKRGAASGTAGNVDALQRYRPLVVGYFYTHLTTLLQRGAAAFSQSEQVVIVHWQTVGAPPDVTEGIAHCSVPQCIDTGHKSCKLLTHPSWNHLLGVSTHNSQDHKQHGDRRADDGENGSHRL